MAVTWSITNLEYNTDSDKGVTRASWSVTDEETVGSVIHTGRVSGAETLIPNPSDAGYITYDDITETDAINWVKTTLGADEVTVVENKVAAQITKSKVPPTASGLPWVVEG